MNVPTEHQDRAYQTIRRRLLEGGLRTRRELSRRRLAAELGVSPGCVQAVLSQLEAEKLLVSRPQSGTYLRTVDVDEYQQLYDLRELIEPYAAGRAAKCITPVQLEVLQQACGEFSAIRAELERSEAAFVPTEHLERALQAEHRFHGTIMDAARNPMAAHFLENLRILSFTAFFARLRPRAVHLVRIRKTIAEHESILVSLRAGDAVAAERTMRVHIRQGRYRLQDVLQELQAAAERPAVDNPE